MTEKTKNTLMRLLSAAIALPIYVYGVYTDHLYCIPVLVVSLIITLVTLHEFYTITDRNTEGKPRIVLGMMIGLAINIIMYMYAFGHLSGINTLLPAIFSGPWDVRVVFAILVLFIIILLSRQVLSGTIKGANYSISTTLFGNIYIVLFFSHIILMKSLENGVFYIVILNIIVMLNDTAAYFGGWLFGKHKTKLQVSPNKTWEGYFSGLAVSIFIMYVCNIVCNSIWGVQLFGTIEALVLGAFLSIAGFMGDLVESLIKRDAVKKDSGSIIPGHGGMWDAFDALIFSIPLFYYYLLLKGIH